MTPLRSLIFVLIAGFFVLPAEAKLFNNNYISFDMPENWKCKSFGTDWVCYSVLSKKKKEAMIILTAKEAGVLDNFQQYQNFLNTPRQNIGLNKKPFTSKVLHSKQIFLNNQPWVDGFHKGSEVPSYYSRYLVTVCCTNNTTKLAILVTYSAHKDHYTKYATQFLKSIKSLRVVNSKNFGNIKGLQEGESIGNIAGYIEDIISDEDEDVDYSDSFFSTKKGQAVSLLLALVALIATTLIVIRKRKKKGKRKKSSSQKRRR